MSRFTVRKQEVSKGRGKTPLYAVYDTERCSYPIEALGRRFESTSNQAVAQALADEMNADPDMWPLPGRETSQSSRRGASS